MRERLELNVKEVFYFKEEVEQYGYCDTCSYEETVIHITYLDSKTECTAHYTLTTDFASLMRELDSIEV